MERRRGKLLCHARHDSGPVEGDGRKELRGSRRGVPQALSRRHRRTSAALRHRLRQRAVHRLRYLEVAATPSKFHPGTFAFHSDDIEYVFGTLDTRPGWNVRPEDRKLSDQMMTYWTNFAKTGDPNGQ